MRSSERAQVLPLVAVVVLLAGGLAVVLGRVAGTRHH